MGTRVWALLVVGLLTMACSASSDLSGEVFVAGKSGEIRRGADVEVILLQANKAFEAEWSQAVNDFAARRARAVAAAKEAEGMLAQVLADRAGASQSALGLLQATAEVDWKAYDQATQRHATASERLLKARRRSREAQAQLETFVPRHRSEGWDLVKKHQTRVVRTDAAGRFEFRGTAPGRYFLASRFRVAGDEVYWLIPVVLEPRVKHATDLTEVNTGWPFS